MFRSLRLKSHRILSIWLFLLIGILVSANLSMAQKTTGAISGSILSQNDRKPLEFAHVVLLVLPDSTFMTGTITDEDGHFVLKELPFGDYFLQIRSLGYAQWSKEIKLSDKVPVVHIGRIMMSEQEFMLDDIEVIGRKEEVSRTMDRKTYDIQDNISLLGGTVLEAVTNLPGVTIDQSGKILIRGSDRVLIMLDGKQSALTGFGAQQALDNIPASGVEKIEIINNPSAKYDASGMAGIINIIFKKTERTGWSGKSGMAIGIGELDNKTSAIDPSVMAYRLTPKINPSAQINYQGLSTKFYCNGDVLLQQKLVRNEIAQRLSENSNILQQYVENRDQPIYNLVLGIDQKIDGQNIIGLSGLYNRRSYVDRGHILYLGQEGDPYFRRWTYTEDEINETLEAAVNYHWNSKTIGKGLKSQLKYASRGKEESFFYLNEMVNFKGNDTLFLSAREQTIEWTVDYSQPLLRGKMELGSLQRRRVFPNQVRFLKGDNSIMDPRLAGYAEYREWLSALYANYSYYYQMWEMEAGLRLEYALIDYLVDENHLFYRSSGFDYLALFPNLRLTRALSNDQFLSFHYNRRVDRPGESNLRSFPTYADPEILRIGNPNLLPQFTQTFELGYKKSWGQGYVYSAGYFRWINQVLTTVIGRFAESKDLVHIDQNAGEGLQTGLEALVTHRFYRWMRLDFNTQVYYHRYNSFSVSYGFPNIENETYSTRTFYSGNIKMIGELSFFKDWKTQLTMIYHAPDLLPQGTIGPRFSIDLGIRGKIWNGKGELFANMTDILNTYRLEIEVLSPNLWFRSTDFFETQVFRIGVNRQF